MKIINRNDWYIHDLGVCEFSNNVDELTKIMIKIIIDLPTEFRVSWCRKSLYSRIKNHF